MPKPRLNPVELASLEITAIDAKLHLFKMKVVQTSVCV